MSRTAGPVDIGRAYRADVAAIPKPRDGWHHDAECRDVYPELFMAQIDSQKDDPNAYAAALGYCLTCPVRVDCLNAELRAEADAAVAVRFGMRGGKTPAERRALWDEAQQAQAAQLGEAS